MFKEVESKRDFPAEEKKILRFWEETDAFRKLVEKNRGREKWSFFDGPITANNPMGVHHAWGRAYKDLYQRYKAMRGFDQRYQNGFDCQGLWVEVEVEKDLGFNSKREIEAFGLDNFSRACRARVEKFSAVMTEQSKRLGQWMDWDHSYYTMDDYNIEHIWYFLKKCHEKGWLYKGHRSMPWCIRCGTSLSQHELVDSYKEVTHRSVYVKLPVVRDAATTDAGPESTVHGPRSTVHDREYLLVWTTTPWTLPANVAVAAQPDLDYVQVRQGDETYYLSKGTVSALRGPYEVVRTLKGRELVGLRYRGPFDTLPALHGVEHRVIEWEAVGEQEGTGLVHIAPGCGAEDFELSRLHNLSVLVPIDDAGNYYRAYGELAGLNAQTVAPTIFDWLDRAGMLYYTHDHTHRYPVCWRCGEELVFKLVDEWFISAAEIRQPMIEAARAVKWYPDWAGKRMEDWLNNMGDWCISRKRFWGLPLMFYPCEGCGELTVIGSRQELEELAVSGLDNLPELHRPWIDEVRIRCPKCGETASRIPEVGDCWLDAGIISFSTLGYLSGDRSYWRAWWPADWVVEMREQIRLWFYSMLFMSVALEGKAPYRQVSVYEKVHDETGRPMHKSWGNAIPFDEAADKAGADLMRWLYLAQNPSNNLNFGYTPLGEVRRKLLVLWNVYSFFSTYARLDGFDPTRASMPAAERSTLDRWLLARLQSLVRTVTDRLERFDAAAATRAIEAFVDDLSNWYVRRSRERFWRTRRDDADKLAAYLTLYEALVTLTELLAPFMPFLAEEMYQNLVRSVDAQAPVSVHLRDWPAANEALIDEELLADMALAQRVVELGRAARSKANLKVRQPLAEVAVRLKSADERPRLEAMADLVLDELNVKRLTFIEEGDELVTYSLKGRPNLLGPKYGKETQALLRAIAGASPAVARAATRGGTATVDRWTLQPEEYEVLIHERPGWSVVEEGEYAVGLSTELTDELRDEGLAGEIRRRVQDLRKQAGFEIADRIVLRFDGDETVRRVMERFGDDIKRETLAVQLSIDGWSETGQRERYTLDGHPVELQVERV